jgi:hypothetical protein
MTIDIPEELARRLQAEPYDLADILEKGLRQNWSERAGPAREVISFFAQGPKPAEILAFRPSADSVHRSRELLRLNRQGELSPAEEAELDEMLRLDQLVTLIKAEARRHLRPPS